MFRWLNKSGVESDKGFVYQRMDRFYAHYTEGNHIMVIYVEGYFPRENEYKLSVDTSSFSKWQPPYEAEIIPEHKIKEIVQNVDEALTFMEIDHEFVEQ